MAHHLVKLLKDNPMIELKFDAEELCASQLSDSEKRELIQHLLDSMDNNRIQMDTVWDAYASLTDKQMKCIQDLVIADMSDKAIEEELDLRRRLNISK